mmetsp:Transcript_9226/g.20491  ORF Transcript_9226/g.20491 Transcript_9226/m.20491 type:complete len:207 (+) Transcript_9226:55-675(+)
MKGYVILAVLFAAAVSQDLFMAGPAPLPSNATYYVFLQRYPLHSVVEVFYHTEVLVCYSKAFSAEDRSYLEGELVGLKDFVELPETWWQGQTVECTELGYGGNLDSKVCSGAPLGRMKLGDRQAVISNADLSQKALYLYGKGGFGGSAAHKRVCQDCWSNWAGIDYNILRNNCNTFTSAVLSCVYGLSQKKPGLGVSDLVTVTCSC